ncbi:bactofilin family protein [Erwinia sp.]|uniref:bactofilin family protein n=1 Tax=Erwinia citreus TaxID=558 RepID=UPI003C766D95
MEKFKKERYLWVLWIFWIFAICAYVFPHYEFFISSLVVMPCFYLLIILFTFAKRMEPYMFNFNKKETNTPEKDPLKMALPHEAKVAYEPADDEATGKETTISSGTKMKGEIINEANISINGHIIGDIGSKKTVQICKEGKVSGKVNSLKILVNGLLKGSCYAKSVTILSRGRIEGDVYAEDFSIEKGGVFIGNSHAIDDKMLADKDPLNGRLKQEIAEVLPKRPENIPNRERIDKTHK